MALQQRGKLVLNKGAGWQIEHDEGAVSLIKEIEKTVHAEAHRRKKSRASVSDKVYAELGKYKDKYVEINLADNGDFGIKDLRDELAAV